MSMLRDCKMQFSPLAEGMVHQKQTLNQQQQQQQWRVLPLSVRMFSYVLTTCSEGRCSGVGQARVTQL